MGNSFFFAFIIKVFETVTLFFFRTVYFSDFIAEPFLSVSCCRFCFVLFVHVLPLAVKECFLACVSMYACWHVAYITFIFVCQCR